MMIYAQSIFKRHEDKTRPLATGFLFDNQIKIIPLFAQNTGLNLYIINKRIKQIKNILSTKKISVNDSKMHMEAFGLNEHYNMFSRKLDFYNGEQNLKSMEAYINSELHKAGKYEPSIRHLLLARAHTAYLHMQNNGFSNGINIINPYYSTDTFTGRSKTTGFNIQGSTEQDLIYPVNAHNSLFIHFDWVSADIRVANVLAGDPNMDHDFINSDPYTILSKKFKLNRDVCKKSFLSSIYSLNPHEPMLGHYAIFCKWVIDNIKRLDEDGYLCSILGRPYYINKGRSRESVFNGRIQGSVAHAMHNIIYKIYKMFPDNLFTEIHDSIIMVCDRSMVRIIINEVGKVMLYPFNGILDSNPKFPTRVSVGNRWKKWKLIKEIH